MEFNSGFKGLNDIKTNETDVEEEQENFQTHYNQQDMKIKKNIHRRHRRKCLKIQGKHIKQLIEGNKTSYKKQI